MPDHAAEYPRPMTYPEALAYLRDRQTGGARFGLTATQALAARCGHPERGLRFLHVAGTNGKGSVCAFLAACLQAAGLRVGLYTSPHLVTVRERIQVDGEPISPADFAARLSALRELLRPVPAAEQPTLFELLTVLALTHFAAVGCEVVVWETGLGGRLDATNIVTPLAAIITNVQLDHEAWLGGSLERIAAEKAGIIKPGVPVFTAATEPTALRVLRAAARARSAPFHQVTPGAPEDPALAGRDLPLPGAHQRLNAGLACATLRALASALPVSAAALRTGLAAALWPGRLQVVVRPDGRGRILLDGAHNAAGAVALRAALTDGFADARLTLVLGLLRDKDATGICRELLPLAARVVLVPVAGRRGAAPAALAAVCRDLLPGGPPPECADSLAAGLAATATEPLVLVAGSLQLIGEALERLGVVPPPALDERGLNDWTA